MVFDPRTNGTVLEQNDTHFITPLFGWFKSQIFPKLHTPLIKKIVLPASCANVI